VQLAFAFHPFHIDFDIFCHVIVNIHRHLARAPFNNGDEAAIPAKRARELGEKADENW
jgi:hypothetical protein